MGNSARKKQAKLQKQKQEELLRKAENAEKQSYQAKEEAIPAEADFDVSTASQFAFGFANNSHTITKQVTVPTLGQTQRSSLSTVQMKKKSSFTAPADARDKSTGAILPPELEPLSPAISEFTMSSFRELDEEDEDDEEEEEEIEMLSAAQMAQKKVTGEENVNFSSELISVDWKCDEGFGPLKLPQMTIKVKRKHAHRYGEPRMADRGFSVLGSVKTLNTESTQASEKSLIPGMSPFEDHRTSEEDLDQIEDHDL